MSDSSDGGSPSLSAGRLRVRLLTAAVLAPALLLYGICFWFAFDGPYQDDYRSVLNFAVVYVHQPSTWSRLVWVIASQHNEYKLIFLHAILGLQLSLFHRMSFPLMEQMGNLFLLPIFWVFWRTAFAEEKDLTRRLMLFAPVSLMLFGLNYAELMDFTTTGLQHLPCVSFGLLALYGLTRPELRSAGFAGACALGALAAFCSGNGLLLAPLGFVFLLREKAWLRGLVWGTSFCMPLAAILYRFMRPEHVPATLVGYVAYYFALMGAAGGWVPLAFVLGLLLVGLWVVALRLRLDRVHACLLLFGTWIVVTGPLVSLARAAGGLGLSTSSRYKINSDLLLMVAYVLLVSFYRESFRGRLLRTPAYLLLLGGSLLFFARGDRFALGFLRGRQRSELAGMKRYEQNPQQTPMRISPEYDAGHQAEGEYERDSLTRAVRDGLYQVPEDAR